MMTATIFGLDATPVHLSLDPGTRSLSWAAFCRAFAWMEKLGVTLDGTSVKLRDHRGAGLATACAMLQAEDIISATALDGWMLWADIGAYGELQSVAGAVPVALAAKAAAAKGIIVAASQAAEAAVAGIPVIAAESVEHLVQHIASLPALRWKSTPPTSTFRPVPAVDMRDIRGLPRARRAVEIAIAGGHNLLLTGSPGAGKTMLARRAVGLLPGLNEPEALDVAAARSVAGVVSHSYFHVERPFRAPHYTVSVAGLLGHRGRPGEVALAHNGILFLDELPEFSRACLEGLREPLETGRVQAMVGERMASMPAKFILIAAMNTCPCGWYGSADRPCLCSDGMRATYQDRIACLRPFFDLEVDVRMTSKESTAPGPSSASIQERVAAARANLRLQRAGRALEIAIAGGHNPPAAGKSERVAATIAALEGSDVVSGMHVAEAASFDGSLTCV